ncbi:MAG TPA: hypothetical protein VFI59_15830 [Actinomycetota bacterium]|nr:hypothetical protein [Actinomycetota bacterium]
MRRLITLLTITGIAALAMVSIAGPAALATMPGQNGRIAFSLDRGSGGEIYTIRADGTDLRRLTHLDGNAIAPDWSPDGTRIVFWLEDQALYVMNRHGGGLHEVTTPGGQAAFTPDGNHLVYSGGRRRNGIFLMRADGSDAPGRRLTTNPLPAAEGGDANPEVSPDGRTVTFLRENGLFAVDIDGTDVRELVSPNLLLVIKHDWAPDGSRIVFTSPYDYSRNPNVFAIDPDGSDPEMLTSATGKLGAFVGTYSPNGRKIVVRVENLDHERFRIFKMRPDGSDRTLIAALPASPRFLDWGSLAES